MHPQDENELIMDLCSKVQDLVEKTGRSAEEVFDICLQQMENEDEEKWTEERRKHL